MDADLLLCTPLPYPSPTYGEGFRRWVRRGRGASAFLFFKMFDIILYQPEIPPNTGNVIRLCANTGAKLRLIKTAGIRSGRQAVAARGTGLP